MNKKEKKQLIKKLKTKNYPLLLKKIASEERNFETFKTVHSVISLLKWQPHLIQSHMAGCRNTISISLIVKPMKTLIFIN